MLTGFVVQAQQDNNNNYLDSLKNWSLHFQLTTIVQGHTGFRGAGYDGQNTLSAQPDTALSVTTTLFLGRRLWRGATLYVNPERTGERGVGHCTYASATQLLQLGVYPTDPPYTLNGISYGGMAIG